MHICVVSGTFHPEPGGPPTYLYHLLPELVRRGHQVEVTTYGEPDAPRDYPYPVTRISRRQPIPLRLAQMTAAVAVAGRRSDVLFVSDYGLPPMLANFILRKPTVLKNVGDFAWEFCTRHRWIRPGQTIDEFQTVRHPVRVRALRKLQAASTRAATRVIAPSHYSAGLVKGWGVPASRIRVVCNALDVAPFAELPPKAEARTVLGLPSAPLILTVARLAPWKNVGALVRVVPEVRRRMPGAQLLVVGDGPMRGELEAQARSLPDDGVIFAGAQPEDRVRLYLRAADVFALYSTYEGLPHVVLEAMAVGTPVLVSQAGGNTEVVDHERNGLAIPVGDDTALADGLTSLLAGGAHVDTLVAAAKVSLERFTWGRMVDETEAVVREVVE